MFETPPTLSLRGIRVEGGEGKLHSGQEKLVILIQLYSNCTMTSLATSNQVQNDISPTAKCVITSAIKGKLADTIEKEPNCKFILSYTLKAPL